MFHVHKCILFRESAYFRALLEGGSSEQSLDLLTVYDADNKAISPELFKEWLTMLYDAKLSDCSDSAFYREDVAIECRLKSYSITALSHYFDSSRITEHLKTSIFRAAHRTEYRVLWLQDLHVAERCHWTIIAFSLKRQIARYLRKIRLDSKYSPPLWFKLAPDVREEILERAIERNIMHELNTDDDSEPSSDDHDSNHGTDEDE